jgi:hypothetical protein
VLQTASLILGFISLSAQASEHFMQFQPVATIDESPDSLHAAIKSAKASGQNCQIKLSAGTGVIS